MSTASIKPSTKPAVSRPAIKSVPQKEKAKAVAFVNWAIPASDDPSKYVLRSSKGFSLFDNEYLTLEDKALIELARQNGGSATVVAELRIVIHHDKPESLDISKIQLKK